MGGKEWTSYETVIIVYFASRGADHEGCAKILDLKKGNKSPRTTLAVRNRLNEARAIDGLWHEGEGWKLAKVDEWLVAQGVSNLHKAIEVGEEELSRIAPVSCGDYYVFR